MWDTGLCFCLASEHSTSCKSFGSTTHFFVRRVRDLCWCDLSPLSLTCVCFVCSPQMCMAGGPHHNISIPTQADIIEHILFWALLLAEIGLTWSWNLRCPETGWIHSSYLWANQTRLMFLRVSSPWKPQDFLVQRINPITKSLSSEYRKKAPEA